MEHNCPECGSKYVGKRVYDHLFNHHYYSKPDIEEFKRKRRLERALAAHPIEDPEIYKCEYCGFEFLTTGGFYRHRLRKHKLYRTAYRVKCPLCIKDLSTQQELVAHAQEEHATRPDEYVVERAELQNRDDFEKWRHDLEKEVGTKFVKVSKRSMEDGLAATTFRCSRALPTPGYRKQRTKKCVENCTAFMRAKERSSGVVEVCYCKTHCGHGSEAEVTVNKGPVGLLSEARQADARLMESNTQLMKEFDETVAALRSKLLRLSSVLDPEVNDHLAKMVELVKDADNLTATMPSLSSVPPDEQPLADV